MSQTPVPLIALVTYPEKPQLSPDDSLLVPQLERAGARVVVVPWSDRTMDWSGCAAAVVRSTWDYHLQLDRFTEWTDRLDGLGVRLMNSASLLRWNAEKTYLRQLQSSGVPVVPTRWICRGDQDSLSDVLKEAQWDQAVVKPVVSASAFETWRTDLDSASGHEPRFRGMVENGEVMVQPYLSEIETAGEWSMVYLGDRFSHAVVKRPKPGDFRVQNQFGGSREVVQPDAELLAAAREVLDNAPDRTTYARIDGCVIGGRFTLMELELIEPELFLGTATHAAHRFARAIMDQVLGSRGLR
jgi:glutathione synthase/RimK-type ligase-like ATP-grasp enzyme